ncbi:MAG: right-handed parallel beta-helix repeat-containing protein, partial [Candidatus Lokiarchaeota archaeon]|nr:right-handed parallel beta-helix repeat-containing protein [Candidatus Lokiarchaeota archaeon]
MIRLKFLRLRENRRKTTFFFFILMILAILSSIEPQGNDLKVLDQERIIKPRTSKYWTLPYPIVIDDSDIQDWAWAAGQDWCNGSGTLSNPYIIENVTINGANGSSCIEIKNSNAYFIIRNCTFYNSSLGSYPYYDAGIKLTTVSNGKIVDNNCSYNQGMGIAIYSSSDNNIVSGNNASHNQKTGIHIYYYCDENTVSGNNASHNQENGIYLRDRCHKNDILGNNANNNQYSGIDLSGCDYSTVSGNNASYNLFYGIYLDGSEENTVLRNKANDNQRSGIYFFWASDNNRISENTASNIYTTNQNEGIYLYYNCKNNSISGNTLNDNINYGMRLEDKCNNNTISENIMSNTGTTNQNCGLYIESSSNNTVTENAFIKNTQYGALINSYGENNTFTYNSFIENGLNAEDNGAENQWNNSAKGNFWSDWVGPDDDGDGIVDDPYSISGSAGSEDGYPLTNTAPEANFSANATLVYGIKPIQFTYNGTGGNLPLSFEWDFGDNTTSTERDPLHVYDTFGVFTVNLTVHDIHEDNDTESKTEYITVLEDTTPIANFSANITLLYESQPIRFNYTGSGGNLPLNFTWHFGDGINSTEQDP